MRRNILVLVVALLSCTTLNRVGSSLSATPAQESAESGPTAPAGNGELVYVAPFCKLLDHPDTQTETYGSSFLLNWGWKATARQYVLDYLESAVTRVTFDGAEVTDAERGDITTDGDVYEVFWEKNLGVLARGKYVMTFYEKYTRKFSDGWSEFGPGTDVESVEDTCYLVVE
jgi:hypothetical protein